MKKCLDTYALVEIGKANPKFTAYFEEEFVITDLTLAEFYFVILKEDNQKSADYWFRKLEPYSVGVNKEILKTAMDYRYNNKKRRISFFDAVGYIYAVKNNLIFVTGDKEFENIKKVEFKK